MTDKTTLEYVLLESAIDRCSRNEETPADLYRIRDAFLKSNRLDDDDELTEQWLRSVGITEETDFEEAMNRFAEECQSGKRTKGDIRKFCAVLNIPLNDPPTPQPPVKEQG